MFSYFYIILIFLSILLSWQAQLLVTQAGYEIYDLYSNDLATFTALTQQGWTVNDYTSSSGSTSGAVVGEIFERDNQFFFRRDMGSTYGAVFDKTYNSLPAHDIVSYHITVAVFEDNTGNRWHSFWADNTQRWNDYIPLSCSFADLCSGPNKDYITHLYGTFSHSSSTLKINPLVGLTATGSGVYFGIRDIKITLRPSQPSFTEFECSFPRGTNAISAGTCICGLKEFFDASSNSCKSCHESCEDCIGPANTDCITCPVSSYYDLSSKTCKSCAAGCLLCSSSAEKDCAQCLPDYFLYWNNSCRTSCELPNMIGRMIGSSKLCLTPCQSTNQYVLWNNTCSSSCNSPAVVRIEGDGKFCNPCQSGLISYFNGTCIPDCPQPYKKRNEGSIQFCDSPCPQDKKFYYLRDSTCRPTCDPPYQVQDQIFCKIDLSPEETKQLGALKQGLGVTNNVTSALGMSISLINSANPLMIFITAFADMLGYIKYLNITYPPALEYSLFIKVEPIFSIIPELPDNALEQIPEYPLSDWFEEDDLSSSFLINFWSPLTILIFICVIVVCSLMVSYCPKRWKKAHQVNSKILEIFRWNFLLTLFTSYFGSIVLCTYLELTTAHPTTFLPLLSFMICLLINLLIFVVIIKMIKIILTQWNLDHENNSAPTEYLAQYSSIFESVKNKYLSQQFFMFFFVVRIYVFVGIICYLYKFPFFQTILVTFLSLSMLIYLAVTRPMKDKVDLIVTIIQEFIMLCAISSVLGLASLDYFKINNDQARVILGEIILKSQIAFSGVAGLYLIFQTFLNLHAAYKIIKTVLKRFRARKTLPTILKTNHLTPIKSQKRRTNQDANPSILQGEDTDLSRMNISTTIEQAIYVSRENLPSKEEVLMKQEENRRRIQRLRKT